MENDYIIEGWTDGSVADGAPVQPSLLGTRHPVYSVQTTTENNKKNIIKLNTVITPQETFRQVASLSS